MIGENEFVEVTIYISTGAKVGDVRRIGTPKGIRKGVVVRDLIDTIPEHTLCGGKKLMPAENYYRVRVKL